MIVACTVAGDSIASLATFAYFIVTSWWIMMLKVVLIWYSYLKRCTFLNDELRLKCVQYATTYI